jgi:hypothetical protein
MLIILYSNVYEPPSHLRGGGGMYLGRTKYTVKKKDNLRNKGDGMSLETSTFTG